MVYLGIEAHDTEKDALAAIKQILNVKLWSSNGHDHHFKELDKSVVDMQYEIAVVESCGLISQMEKETNKIQIHEVKPLEQALELFGFFVRELKKEYNEQRVQNGIFGKKMEIHLITDGPLTIM